MVRSSAQWSRSEIVVAATMIGIQAFAMWNDFGLPSFLLLLIAAPFLFGRTKWDGEISAYSVCNKDGHRIAGTFTAEQFDAQLRGVPRPDAPSPSQPTMNTIPFLARAPASIHFTERQRRAEAAAAAAERRMRVHL